MYKLCKTEQSMARQRELEQGLLEAMLNQQYDEISVSDLCDRMNIPRKSFYRYFSGKQGALYALIDHTIMEFESFSTKENSREFVSHEKELENYFLFWQNQKHLLEAMAKSGLEGVLVTRAMENAIRELGCPNRMLPRKDPEATESAMAFSVAGLMVMVLRWFASDFSMPAAKIAQITVDLVTNPLFDPNFA